MHDLQYCQVMHISLFRVIGAFLVYFVSYMIPPIIYLFWVHTSSEYVDLSDEFVAKSHLFVILSFTLGVLLYLLALGKPFFLRLIGKISLKAFLIGTISTIILIPIVFLVKEGLFALLEHFTHVKMEAEQKFVEQMRNLLKLNHFAIFYLLALCVAILGPIIEEILFRGFLQGWLREKGSKNLAIIITAIVFTLFHYEVSLGISNIELLIPLFIMGLSLSYLKEREESLLAPIGLHIAFNAFGILGILLFDQNEILKL